MCTLIKWERRLGPLHHPRTAGETSPSGRPWLPAGLGGMCHHTLSRFSSVTARGRCGGAAPGHAAEAACSVTAAESLAPGHRSADGERQVPRHLSQSGLTGSPGSSGRLTSGLRLGKEAELHGESGRTCDADLPCLPPSRPGTDLVGADGTLSPTRSNSQQPCSLRKIP